MSIIIIPRHRNTNSGSNFAWLEATYVCLAGFTSAQELPNFNLICRHNQWIGTVPLPCVAARDQTQQEAMQLLKFNETLCPSDGVCDQLCSVNTRTGQHECSCFKGYLMRDGVCQGQWISSLSSLPSCVWRIKFQFYSPPFSIHPQTLTSVRGMQFANLENASTQLVRSVATVPGDSGGMGNIVWVSDKF